MPRCSSSAQASAGNLALPTLADLAKERERFLNDGTFADVFAVVYFHTTRLILEAGRAGCFHYPEVVEAQQAQFHRAYQQRGSLGHWRPYLQAAGQRQLRRGTDPGTLLYRLLEYGMIAHIQGDLPLALRATRPEMLPWEALASDFFSLDPLFDKAVHAALEDFPRTTDRHCGALRTTHREALEFGIWLLARFGGGTIRVRQLRHRAWEKAIAVTF